LPEPVARGTAQRLLVPARAADDPRPARPRQRPPGERRRPGAAGSLAAAPDARRLGPHPLRPGQPRPVAVREARPAGARRRVAEYYRTQHPYLSLESRQMLLEPAVVEAAVRAAAKTGLRAAPTLVYLANTIADGHGNAIPYSVVAALDAMQAPPLGRFVLPPGATLGKNGRIHVNIPTRFESLRDDEIVLAAWSESPLQLKPGDPVTLTYFLP